MATDDDAPRTASDVLDRVQVEWAALEYAVAALTEAQLAAPGPEGWSVKDHLMHIGDWERAVTAVLRGRPQHEGFGLSAETYAGFSDDLDGLNDVLYRRSKAVSLSEVQARRRRAHAEVLAALASLTDADITKSIAAYGGDATDARPLVTKIAGDTYAHYAEHTLWIHELLSKL